MHYCDVSINEIGDVKQIMYGELNSGTPRDSWEEITEEVISNTLDTHGIPDPDLLIRTCNEQRISNFLLWQLAYTEFYVTPVPWPDFSKEELVKAIEAYTKRDRRFGLVKEP